MRINTVDLLRLAEQKYGSLSAVARKTKLLRSTLKRIKNGETKSPHPQTIAHLVKAINCGE